VVFANGATLAASTVYYLRLSRSGANDTTNYYQCRLRSVDPFPGVLWSKNNETWSAGSNYLAYATITATVAPSWLALPAQAAGGVPVRYADSANLTDQAATTQQIGSGTFAAGRVYESAHAETVAFTVAGSTELEAVVEVVDPEAAVGDDIDFRVVREV
jgi:hypothetical protein